MSVFAASLAMDGRQWTDQYLQPRGGSAADKNQDRKQKLIDGLEKWLAMKSPPIMLRLAVGLLWSALVTHFWNIHHTVA